MCNCSGGISNVNIIRKEIAPLRVVRPPKNTSVTIVKKEVDKYRA